MVVVINEVAEVLSAQSCHRIAKRILDIFEEHLHLSKKETVGVLSKGTKEGEKTVISTKDGIRKLWIRHFGNRVELLIQFGKDDKSSLVDEFVVFSEKDFRAARRERLPVVLDYPCGRKVPAHFADISEDEAQTVAMHEKIEEQQG